MPSANLSPPVKATVTKFLHLFTNQLTIYHNYPRLLRSCKDLKSLLQIHAHILISGVKLDDFTYTQLVNSYSLFRKCGSARLVFDSAVKPSVILWNSMIRAYTKSNLNREALNLYNKMLEKGAEPDKYTFTFVLKACTGTHNLEEGIKIHHKIALKKLESDVYIGTGLIDMYCKLGNATIARDLFDKMPVLDVVAWNAMIAGFSQSKESYEALRFFRNMQLAGLEPNSVSVLNLLPSISQLWNILLCKAIHGFVVRRAFPSAVSNGLIDTYSKCGQVDIARLVFDQIVDRDDVSWGTMMAGYVHNGSFLETLDLFDSLKSADWKLNQVSAMSALSAAAEVRDLDKGKEIHDYATQERIDSDVAVATSLMSMYAKCGESEKAKQLFKGIPSKDIVAWSAIIAAFSQTGHSVEALSLFREMQEGNNKANRITIMSVLPACAELSSINPGKSLHCYVIKSDIGLDVSTGTALVSMYAKCGYFNQAQLLFNRMQDKDVVTWNALINGYAQIGDANHAMEMFHQLRLAGYLPDSGTMVGVLPSCVLMDALQEGTCIHGHIIKSGFIADPHVKNALIDMYAKCRDLSTAEQLFNETEFTKDEVTWNILIAGYMQNGRANDAISSFHMMRLENLQPTLITIVSILPAAAYLAAIRKGMSLHAFVIKIGFETHVLVGNCLIDMYAKCGRLECSEEFFSSMCNRDTVSWNVMLAGYAVHGLGDPAVALFSQMLENCNEVDSVSFLSVLSACRHGGLIEEGRNIFHSMGSKHQIEPGLEHYACMVDLLGRAGQLDEAWDFVQSMAMPPDAAVWGALLGACRLHSNIKLGEIALNHLVKLEPQNPAHHVVLSNIYAQSGRWGEVGKTRMTMNSLGLMKTPGCSWVEIKNKVHAFRVGDQTHPQIKDISLLWDDLLQKMEKMGYIPDTSSILQNVEEEEKELFLFGHSERLAIAFALLNTEPGLPIQIVKNLRVCPDCHTTTKFISKITERKIIVRDATRFHHFESGACSCKDYW
ncbi:hypothetical protein AQUCO_00900782v1 [Aquilegia coerulea]|uniref:DYW domain-containing protein n=1 Tax=Aquilegia coerulea TaxID=218851 RepID=A0A2G5EFH7_AQUCA|nr:hypothetical protein AQUCO_00900782v1 [Aquilegia coerulea]